MPARPRPRSDGGAPRLVLLTEHVVDKQRKLITTPAYMLAQRISEAATGIEKTVAELMAMA